VKQGRREAILPTLLNKALENLRIKIRKQPTPYTGGERLTYSHPKIFQILIQENKQTLSMFVFTKMSAEESLHFHGQRKSK
jgi:hypothetical protein